MKKLNFSFSGVIIALVALMTFVSCSKTESAGGGATPCTNCGGSPSPTVTLPLPITIALFIGSGLDVTYSSNTAVATMQINGQPAPVSGTVHLYNLQKDTILVFAPNGDATKATSYTVPVLKPVKNNMAHLSITSWENIWRTVNGAPVQAGCPTNPNLKFFPSGDSCRVFNAPCGTGGNGPSFFSLDNSESYTTISNQTWKVTKSTSDSLNLESLDGTVKKGYAARH